MTTISRADADELLDLVKQCRASARDVAYALPKLDPAKIEAATDADDTAYTAVVDWVYGRTAGLSRRTGLG